MKLFRLLAFWPLAALCVLLAVRWLPADAYPGTQSTQASEAVAALLAAAACLPFARRRQQVVQTPGRLWTAWPAGALLFMGLNPAVLLPGVALKSTDLMISLALAPVVIAVALVTLGEREGGLNGTDVAPGIAAAAGLMLIVPVPSLASFASVAVLLLAPLCIGAGAIWLVGRTDHVLTATQAAVALAGAGCVFGALALRPPRFAPQLAATGLDLLTVLLTMLALRSSGVRRFGAQFAIVPLLLLLEGLLLTRVRPDWEQSGGLLLLLAASVLLLRTPPGPDRAESPRLFP